MICGLCQAQLSGPQPFKLSGDVSAIQPPVAKVFLTYQSDGERKTDSAQVVEGKYHFSGLVSEPVMGSLRAVYKADAAGTVMPSSYKRDVAAVFLQAGALTVQSLDSFSHVSVKGSKAHEAFLALKQSVKPIQTRLDDLSAQYSQLYKAKDSAGMRALEPAFTAVDEDMKAAYAAFVRANPKSPVAPYAVNQAAGWDVDPDKVEPLLKLLPASSRELPTARLLKEKIETARKTGIGRLAMDFTQPDTSGIPVSLSSFRGKYLLVDFWASWCGPCRAENPNVVKVFNTYKDKGFYVLGVSLDQPTGKEKWLKAIHDDGLTWSHVSDLKFWNNAVAVQYGIQAIPQNLLLDPGGKIIAKNLRGAELEKKLAELFAGK